MSNVHIATAAHEVASALPSTATVTVSKHGISSIETLNLEAQTASQTHLMWSRTFSGMEIVTNPYIHYMVEATMDFASDLSINNDTRLQLFKSVRLTSDPISNAASNISVTVNNAEMTITPDKEYRLINTTFPDTKATSHQRQHYGLNQLDQFADPNAREFANASLPDDIEKQHNANALRETYPKRMYYKTDAVDSQYTLLTDTSTPINSVRSVKFIFDVYQPLSHPYFRDNVLRDNTLVNLRYFDCQIYLSDTGKLVEFSRPTADVATFENLAEKLATCTFSSKLLLNTDSVATTSGIKPTLIFDLVTPAVPLPTISDKPIKVLHTMTSVQIDSQSDMENVRSGNIQLSQVPDMIYVFLRSSKMDDVREAYLDQVPTRLGVCTNLRVRTPQNSAFLLNMDQESLYQMSTRNGSKQSRSAFMSTLGSVICIDPELDLGGYVNGVLAPFTFEVTGDFSRPCENETKSRLWYHDVSNVNQSDGTGGFANAVPTASISSSEMFTLYVVCELHGHLYLMSDGTGKQTKSNLTVSEVAEAVGHGVHHPSTFPDGRVQKMDSGVLAEVADASADVGDDVRAALRD